MLTRLPASKDEIVAELCTRRLSRFVREAWPIVEPATPMVNAWHIDVVCEHLEAVSAGELHRLIINVPPRTMKSLAVAVFWPCWEWLRKPELRWLFATYAADLSTRDSVKCRRLIESQGGRSDGGLLERGGYQGLLRLLSDDPWRLAGDQNAKTKYETSRTGMRLATSVGGIATGEGGDRIVVDDPLNAKQARSDADRNAANRWWDETMTTRFNNADAAAVIVMQRLHQDDLTGHLAAKGGWHHLCLPAEYEPKHPFVYPDRVTLPSGRELTGDRRTVAGELLDPVRLGPDRLAELRRDLGSYGYAGQMQQRPSPDEGGIFKRHWWRRPWDATLGPDDPSGLPLDWMFDHVIASWDMRFSEAGGGTSYVVGQVWGAYGADRYLLGQVRAKLGFTETVAALIAVKAKWPRISAILVEKKANGAAVLDVLARKVPGLVPIEPEGGKEVRASAVEPYVEAGNLRLPVTDYIACPEGFTPTSVQDFIEEHAVFPNGVNDDQVDAMTQAITWLELRVPHHIPSDGGEVMQSITGDLLKLDF